MCRRRSSSAVARPAGPPPTIRTVSARAPTTSRDRRSQGPLVLDELARVLVENHKPKLGPRIDHVEMPVARKVRDAAVPPHFLAGLQGHVVGTLRRPPEVR